MSLFSQPGSRLDRLDSLRGIAILAVIVHHLAIFDAPAGLAGRLYVSLAEFFSHGVDLFFVLSGFLLVKTLPLSPQPGWLTGFWVRRVAKILPLYALVVAGVFLIAPALLALAGLTTKAETLRQGAADWPWHALFATNWLFFRTGEFTHPLLNVAWSLGVEVQFYGLLSIAWLAGWARSPRFWLVLAAVAVASRCAGVALGWNWVSLLNFTPGRLDAFAAGALVALRPGWFTRPVRLLGAAVLFAPLVLVWSREVLWLQTLGYTWVALGAAVAVRGAAVPTPATAVAPRRAPLVFLGCISYSVYLTHIAVRSGVRDLLVPADLVPGSAPYWAAHVVYGVIVITCSAFFGWVVWRVVEAPAQSFLLSRLRPATPPRKLD